MRRAVPIAALALTIAVRASAAPFAVNTVADGHDATPGDGVCETASGNGICTLRAAIEETSALGGTRTVDVPAGMYMLSVTGACDGVALCVTGTPTVTLTGAGADTTIVDANAASNPPNGFGRVFEVGSGATVTVSGVTFTDGASQPPFPGGMAGGVRNTGTLTLIDSVVSNSSGGYGGGIYNSNSLTLTRTIVSGNTALISYGAGGGLTNDGGIVTMTESAFRNNHAHSNGGGIFNFVSPGGGTITAYGCEISGNVSDGGGGGLENNNFSVTSLTNSTISGNMASTGGGINLYDSATVNLNNVTITGNVADASHTGGVGGGISMNGATLNVANSIIAGNTDNSGFAPDCSAPAPGSALTSQGYNLLGDATDCTGLGSGTHDIIGMAANLDVLALNGNTNGPTQTHALLAGSPAIDGGNPATPGSGGDACAANDQRGVARVQPGDAICDIGAYEAVPKPTTTTTSSTTSTTHATTSSTTTSTTHPTTTSTTPTTTTTTSPPTTSTTTTTTTLPSGDCGSEPVSATFASIDCRLAALLARVTGEPDLGASGPKLVQNLSSAKDAEEAGAKACAASDLKRARQRLKQAIQDMIEYAHHLETLRARKKLPGALRTDLLAAGNPITDDAKSLKRTVQCPADAPR